MQKVEQARVHHVFLAVAPVTHHAHGLRQGARHVLAVFPVDRVQHFAGVQVVDAGPADIDIGKGGGELSGGRRGGRDQRGLHHRMQQRLAGLHLRQLGGVTQAAESRSARGGGDRPRAEREELTSGEFHKPLPEAADTRRQRVPYRL